MFEITKDRILHDSKSGLLIKIEVVESIAAEGRDKAEEIVDELGRPIKAYGSATLVVSDEDGE